MNYMPCHLEAKVSLLVLLFFSLETILNSENSHITKHMVF